MVHSLLLSQSLWVRSIFHEMDRYTISFHKTVFLLFFFLQKALDMFVFASSKEYLQHLHTNQGFVSNLLIKPQNSDTCLPMLEQRIVGVWISNRGIQSHSQSILTRSEMFHNQRQFRLMLPFISVHKIKITAASLSLL